jgi:hypothetical protein
MHVEVLQVHKLQPAQYLPPYFHFLLPRDAQPNLMNVRNEPKQGHSSVRVTPSD